jgi:hypothetical protein
MQSFFLLAFIVALAGRALAFSQITVGPQNVSTSDLLTVSDGPVKDACRTQCDTAASQFNGCGDDATCQCSNATVQSFFDCQQCYFTALINLNTRAEANVGSTPVLSGLYAACSAAKQSNFTPSVLAVTDNWDGPVGIDLGIPGTVLGCIAVVGMATSALLIFGNM